jgi:hypothetical protein
VWVVAAAEEEEEEVVVASDACAEIHGALKVYVEIHFALAIENYLLAS